MKLKLVLGKTGQMARSIFSPSAWKRRFVLRAHPDALHVRVPPNGLLAGEVLRELLKQREQEK